MRTLPSFAARPDQFLALAFIQAKWLLHEYVFARLKGGLGQRRNAWIAGAAMAIASTCELAMASSNRSDIVTPGAICVAVARPASAGSQTISRWPKTLKFRTRFLPQCPQPRTAILGFMMFPCRPCTCRGRFIDCLQRPAHSPRLIAWRARRPPYPGLIRTGMGA